MSFILWQKRFLFGCAHFLRRDISGSVAVIAAFCMLVVLGFVSLALDYGSSQAIRPKWEAAADAAAITGIRVALDRVAELGWDNWEVAQAQAISAAVSAFSNNLDESSRAGMQYADPAVAVWLANGTYQVQSHIGWKTTKTLSLARAMGMSSIKMEGESTARSDPAQYTQFVFLIDTSGSMGIGGTAAAITALQNDPDIQCSFACHDPNHFRIGTDTRAIARSKSIKLKIDFVNDALKTFMDKITARNASAGMPNLYSVGLYKFGGPLGTILAPTTDLAAATAAANTVDVDAQTFDEQPTFYTYMNDGLTSLAGKLTNIGDWSGPTRRKTFGVLLTDGIQDLPYPGFRQTNTDYAAGCNALKAKGATVVSILAPVLPLTGRAYDSAESDKLIRPLVSQIPMAIRSCSSNPSVNYFEATDGPDIATAVTTMTNQAVTPLGLLN